MSALTVRLRVLSAAGAPSSGDRSKSPGSTGSLSLLTPSQIARQDGLQQMAGVQVLQEHSPA
ncbi:MAG: hypothetical protein V3S54_05420 [Woeseiaceae bacterium]